MDKFDKKHDVSSKKKRKRRKGLEKEEKPKKSSTKGSKKNPAPKPSKTPNVKQEDSKEILRASSGSSTDCHKPERKIQR
jgi:hypothetical protein